jgi:hypothetical protein
VGIGRQSGTLVLPTFILSAGIAGHVLLGLLPVPHDSRWLTPGVVSARWDREKALAAVERKKGRARLWISHRGDRPLPQEWFYNRYLGDSLYGDLKPYVRLSDDPEQRKLGFPKGFDFEPWIRDALIRHSEAESKFTQAAFAFYENRTPAAIDRCRETWPDLEAAYEELRDTLRAGN